MFSYSHGFPVALTPVLILVAALAITFWVWDGPQFSQATRIVCSVLTCMIAGILAVFVCAGYSIESSATVIVYEAFLLAIQFGISHIAHATKTPS